MPPCVTSLATSGDLEQLLPLIRGYQAFYEIATVSDEQTRSFFGAVIENTAESFIVVARTDGEMIGFATGYITVSGYLACRLVHMGDLFVKPERRGQGVGRTLIAAVAQHAQGLGLSIVRWLTSPSNTDAHRLYDSVGAVPSEHLLHVLQVSKLRQ